MNAGDWDALGSFDELVTGWLQRRHLLLRTNCHQPACRAAIECVRTPSSEWRSRAARVTRDAARHQRVSMSAVNLRAEKAQSVAAASRRFAGCGRERFQADPPREQLALRPQAVPANAA